MTAGDLDVKAILERAEAQLSLWRSRSQLVFDDKDAQTVFDLCAEVERLRSELSDLRDMHEDETSVQKDAYEKLLGELENVRIASRRLVAAADEGQRLAVDRLIDTNLPLRNELAASAEALRQAKEALVDSAKELLAVKADEARTGEALRVEKEAHADTRFLADDRDKRLTQYEDVEMPALEADNERLRAALRRSVPSCGCMGCVVAKQDVDAALGVVLPEAAQPDLMGKALAPTPEKTKETT